MENKPSFWMTLPGVLTGLAALVTALSGFYLAVRDDIATVVAPPTGTSQQQTLTGDATDATHAMPLVRTDAIVPGDALPMLVPADEPAPPASGTTTGTLVDCSNADFQLPNTIRSLMSWSDNYHGQIVAAAGAKGQATYPCQQALSYRGSAHCQRPDDIAIRQALFETLSLCRAAGLDLDHLSRK